jgi:hypothetical protein
MSGYLLATYLPEESSNDEAAEEPHQRPRQLWLIIGLMTMTSPILITMFDSCIREPEKQTTGGVVSAGEEDGQEQLRRSRERNSGNSGALTTSDDVDQSDQTNESTVATFEIGRNSSNFVIEEEE